MPDAPLSDDHGSRLGLWIKRAVFLILPILVLVGSIAGVMVMGAIAPKPEEKEEVVEALPVLTAMAEIDTVQLTVRTQGEVVPRSEVTLASEVNGRISYMSPNFLPGRSFRRGETLVRIDPKEFELRVVQANAAVAQAQTALMQEKSQAELAALDAEDLGLERVSDLTLRRPQLAEAEARLASARASLAEAELLLSRTTITAPFTGRVKSKSVDLGAYVAPGTRLGDAFASNVMDVPVPLTDADLARLNLGIGFAATEDQPGPDVVLSATIAGRPHTWQGRITRTDSGFDSETRVLFAYVEVTDPYGKAAAQGAPLAAGLFVTADIEGESIENAVVIPRTALRGTNEVFVATADDTLEIRTVSVVSSDRNKAILTAGLEAGESVITSPVRGAADGMKINPVNRLQIGGEDAVASAEREIQLVDNSN